MERYIKVLYELVREEVKASRIDSAKLVKTERVRVNAMLNIQDRAIIKAAKNTNKSVTSLQESKLICVDSTHRNETHIALCKNGQTLFLQYVKGSWTLALNIPLSGLKKVPMPIVNYQRSIGARSANMMIIKIR